MISIETTRKLFRATDAAGYTITLQRSCDDVYLDILIFLGDNIMITMLYR